jgi:uncharacterized protein
MTGLETAFTPWASLAGGVLIGIAATALMALHGRIAGMTAILGGIIPPLASDWQWRAAFLAGSIAVAVLYAAFAGPVPFMSPTPLGWLIFGGIVVGIGVTFGSGCTSGHGICGIARLSPRSIVATVIFMASTFATVTIIRHVI